MAPRRTSKVNDHTQRKLDIAKSQMREYLLHHMIDAAVTTTDECVVVTVYRSEDVELIPERSRGVRVETTVDLSQ
jgi:hypothetical protein